MDSNVISISGFHKLIVRAAGDLYLRSWETADQLEVGGNEMIETRQENDVLHLTSLEDLHLSVPTGLFVVAERVGGDASIMSIEKIEVRQVGGDLMMRGVNSAVIMSVGGDFEALDVASLSFQAAGGDFEGKNVQLSGACHVGGDFSALLLTGSGSVTAGGDIEAKLQPAAGQEVTLRAGGDIELFLPVDAAADLDIRSGSRDILIRQGDDELEIEKREYAYTLGGGGAKLHLMAGGDVVVTDEAWEDDDLEDDFQEMAEDMQRSFERAARRGANRMAHLADRVEDASRRAQDRIDAAMKRMEQRGYRFGATVPPAPPATPVVPPAPEVKEGVSDEERMLILKMLQEKKITVEEAENLLEALEG